MIERNKEERRKARKAEKELREKQHLFLLQVDIGEVRTCAKTTSGEIRMDMDFDNTNLGDSALVLDKDLRWMNRIQHTDGENELKWKGFMFVYLRCTLDLPRECRNLNYVEG